MKDSIQKKRIQFVALLLGVVACAGDGTGLDENGEPFMPTTGVELSVDDLALPVGASFVLGVTTSDAQGNPVTDRPVTWASSNTSVATVDIAGVVTALTAGVTTISATSDGAVDNAETVVVTSSAFAADVQPIFSANCAFNGCHAGPTSQLGQDLSVGNAYSNIVNVASMQVPTLNRVTPGDAAGSYLLHKLRGTFADVGGTGGLMPVGGGQLPDSEIDIVRAWVHAGALNN